MKRSTLRAGIWIALLAGCQAAPEKHYPLQAEVIQTNPDAKSITVTHGDIPGLMPAMTMTYMVAEPKEMESLKPGDTISAELVVSDNKGRLEKIVLLHHGDAKAPGSSLRAPQPGDEVPDVALVDQDKKTIHFRDFRGKALLVTFIYTRCPMPDFCPRMNDNFREVQKLLAATPEAAKNVAFLSISFDPAHDTPSVLKHYSALNHDAKTPAFVWDFAAPAEKDLPALANAFGLEYKPDGAQIVHSLSTTLIGPDGKVKQWYSGNDWTPADLSSAVTALFKAS
jgi:protein SCO1